MKIKMYLALCITSLSSIQYGHAQDQSEADLYSQCVGQVIVENKLPSINNAVVEACSTQATQNYQKQIVKLLDKIKAQSQENKQPERYQKIMKSQQLWKAYVDQECQNAGEFIGSPMYGFCPMTEYKSRVASLGEYAQ